MMHTIRLPWSNPLSFARTIWQQPGDMVFLYSGMQTSFTGRYSYLAYQPSRSVTSNHFEEFSSLLTQNHWQLENSWFGYLGYELKHDVEQLTAASAPSPISLPALWMIQCDRILVFDHQEHTCTLHSKHPNPSLPIAKVSAVSPAVQVTSLSSNMDKTAYIQQVQHTLEAIRRGDFYQANITRKFYGSLNIQGDISELFAHLCSISPAPYSAFLRLGDTHILSSSPEQFITLDAEGTAHTRPIKGSAARFANPSADQQSLQKLKDSSKDQMENLMIVDLMRHDLAKSSLPGSVKVERLFEVTPYATIYHMSSTISAVKDPAYSTLHFVQQAFPPGSMTGAPKIKAIEHCNSAEGHARGVYSGAIGWFGGDGSCDLSVVIRTLLIRGNQFEFQVGGAIVADSDPHTEWQETLLKAKALAQLLNLQNDKDLLF